MLLLHFLQALVEDALHRCASGQKPREGDTSINAQMLRQLCEPREVLMSRGLRVTLGEDTIVLDGAKLVQRLDAMTLSRGLLAKRPV